MRRLRFRKKALFALTGLVALGLLAGGRPVAAVAAIAAAGASVAVLVCAGALAGFLVAWLMKSRRRGELFTLLFVLGISLASFLPIFASRIQDPDGTPDPELGGRRPRRHSGPQRWRSGSR